jgi:hypothetical protein
MSNILFSKKFLSKLTATIRSFWWSGIKDEPNTKSLCLRAWADICTPKEDGGLGIRNIQVINQGLILSAAWRLAKDHTNHLALILRSKYHPDTSICKAKANKPKSAFWSAILKVQPLLKSAAFYPIFDGNSSIWSSPWFPGWENIHENLNIQPPPFVYPAVVRDLWLPNQKIWNIELIRKLFAPHIAQEIIRTPIINAHGDDNLCWKLTHAGKWSSKSAYKHCRNNLVLPPNQQPKEVPTQVKHLLQQVWKDKKMIPRVQTFAWRLLRRALPTCKRAGRFSIHIKKDCTRCGLVEDDLHLFFLRPFARAAWFCQPWFIRSEVYASVHHSIPSIIHAILAYVHPIASTTNIFTFMWCLWKSRNDDLFGRKISRPAQIYAATNVILQGSLLEDSSSLQVRVPVTTIPNCNQGTIKPGTSLQDLSTFPGTVKGHGCRLEGGE